MRIRPDEVAAAIKSGVNQKIPDGNNLYLLVRPGLLDIPIPRRCCHP
jgi:hypothetical protein